MVKGGRAVGREREGGKAHTVSAVVYVLANDVDSPWSSACKPVGKEGKEAGSTVMRTPSPDAATGRAIRENTTATCYTALSVICVFPNHVGLQDHSFSNSATRLRRRSCSTESVAWINAGGAFSYASASASSKLARSCPCLSIPTPRFQTLVRSCQTPLFGGLGGKW